MSDIAATMLCTVSATKWPGLIGLIWQELPMIVLLLIVLAMKPAGLFGKTAIKKV